VRKSPDELKAIQSNKIQAIVKHAYATVPYYRSLFDTNNIKPKDIRNSDDLKHIPVSTKQDLRTAGETVISCLYQKAGLIPRTTGGSSGTTLFFYHSPRDVLYANASYDRARMQNLFSPLYNKIVMIGVFREESCCWHRLREKIEYVLAFRRRPIFLDMGQSQQIIDGILARASYDSIKGYPSFLYLLAHRVRSGLLRLPGLRHVFTASETLDAKSREFINSTLNVDVKDIYGCWEGGCIGWECAKHEGYHVNLDFVALQVVDEANVSREYGTGNLVLTNLNSYAVPFIRYQTDDVVELTPDLCSCGKPLPLIKSLFGRQDDFIVLPDERMLSPPGLLAVMYGCSNLLQYQITQERRDELFVRVVLVDPAHSQSTEDEITRCLQSYLSCDDMKVFVATVDKIDRTVSGKHKCIVSKLARDR
jgi:phenylacetate-CoA ligase